MATATSPGRAVRRDICGVHSVEFGQVYVRNDETHESGWFPKFCPQCEKVFAGEERWKAEVAKQVEEIAAEADKRSAADAARPARIEQEATEMMAEDAGNYVLKYFAQNRAKYEAHAAERDWNRVAAGVTAERREEFLERIVKIAGLGSEKEKR